MSAELQAGRWLRVSKSKNPVRKRRVQVGDLLKVMSDPAEMVRQSPRAPKPRIMIETMQVVGGECSLTAQDHALYEIMLAWARKHGLDKDTHEIPAEAVKAYLGTARWDDVRRSTERLSSVMVRYDFRDEEWRRTGRIALVSVGLKESLKDGAAKFVEFEIPARIRAVMAEARDYAKLELGAFPKFTCKYTAALYQRLALRAGYDEVLIRPWEIEPGKLAADLGYPMRDGVLAYAEFRKRCLDPVLADLGYGVTRFVTTLEEVRGTGRGRPVEKLVWHVTPATKTVHEAPRAPLAVGELELVHSADAVHPSSSMPKSGTVRRVVHHLKRALTVEELVEGWRAALDELAEGELAEGVPAPVPYVDVAGADLAEQIERFGYDAAFSAWALGAAKTRRLLVRQPSTEEKAAKAAAAQAMASAEHGDFDAATDIVVRLDPEADFAPVLQYLSSLTGRNGTKLLTVEVERADGLRSQVIGWVRLDEEQRAALHALPGVEAIRYVVIDREQPQEETREAKIARRRAGLAEDMLGTLAKECHPRLVLDMLDPDMSPWTDCHPFLPNNGAQFKMALSLLEPELRRLLKEEKIERVAVSPELRRVKATLVNFAKAARDGDFERLTKVARAIHAVATQAARQDA